MTTLQTPARAEIEGHHQSMLRTWITSTKQVYIAILLCCNFKCLWQICTVSAASLISHFSAFNSVILHKEPSSLGMETPCVYESCLSGKKTKLVCTTGCQLRKQSCATLNQIMSLKSIVSAAQCYHMGTNGYAMARQCHQAWQVLTLTSYTVIFSLYANELR